MSIEHAVQRAILYVLYLGLMFAVGWLVRLFVEAARERMLPAPQPPEPIDPWTIVTQTIQHPRQMPDGTWQRAELVWKPCDAPLVRGQFEIHIPTDPEHRAQCEECRTGTRANYSGASFRAL